MRTARYAIGLLVIAMIVAFGAGCGSESPESEDPLSAGFEMIGKPQAASIPSLEFVDPSSVRGDSQEFDVGVLLEPNSYSALLTGERVTHVQWAVVPGTDQRVLMIWLDAGGAELLREWTAQHVGDEILFVVENRVLVVSQVLEPITEGSIAIHEDDPGALSDLEDAIVPSI